MQSKLSKIATIQTGVYAKPSHHGDAIYLQSRHIDSSGDFDKNLQPDITLDDRTSKFILKSGDLLFTAKGYKNISVIYESKLGLAVASSTFFIIRVNNNVVTPEYLSWFLNHPRTQKYLKAQAKGASPPSISIGTLEELQIEVPDIAAQQEILRVHSLRKKEASIIQQIEVLKEQALQYRLYHSTIKKDGAL